MKRFAIAISIIILVVMLSPRFSILAQPTHTPHENPAMAKGSPDPVSLLRFYRKVFDLAVIRQYQDAQSLLNELEYADIPYELRYTVSSYNRLSSQLLTTLNNLEALLDETSTLFTSGQTSIAKQKLNEAEATIRNALFLLEDAEAVTDTLGEELGVFAAAAGSDIRLAYESQQQNLLRLRQLINELNQLRESLGLNPLMAIETSFYYPTLLEVSAPETAHHGRPVTISGRVSSTDGTIERTVQVLLDNTQLAEETIQGQFSLEITPPPQILTGRHSLTLVVIPQGRHAGASKSLAINISGTSIQADIEAPRLLIVPTSIRISGKIYHSLGPVQDARVRLTFKDFSTTVKTATDGSFTTTIDAPLDLSLVGPQELAITVEPVEPWYASLEAKRQIFVINPAIIGVMLVAFISLGLVVFTRVRTRPPRLREEMVIPETGLREPLIVAPAPRPKYEVIGIKGRIVSAYLNGLGVVERVTGISMAPPTTLREFLNAAAPQLPTAIKPFVELTLIAESALYSAYKLDESTAAKAEQLVAIIKEELYSGAA